MWMGRNGVGDPAWRVAFGEWMKWGMVLDRDMMTEEQQRIAWGRLRLGIFGVGLWVGLALVALVGLKWGEPVTLTGWEVMAGVMGVVVMQGILDWVGGLVLMPEPRPGLGTWLGGWFRGVLIQTGVMAGMGVLAWGSFRFSGGFCGGVAVGSVILVWIRPMLLRLMSGGRMGWETVGGRRMQVVEVEDRGFTGGVRWGWGRVKELIPRHWLKTVSEEELGVELERRRWQLEQRLPRRVWWLLLGWNLIGVELGSRLLGFRDMPEWNALVAYGCWMTVWCFVGLLVLPSASRGSVHAADRAVTQLDRDPRPWIRRFAALTGEDGSSGATVQAVFYPIPSTALRLGRLQEGGGGRDRVVVGEPGTEQPLLFVGDPDAAGAGGALQRGATGVVGVPAGCLTGESLACHGLPWSAAFPHFATTVQSPPFKSWDAFTTTSWRPWAAPRWSA